MKLQKIKKSDLISLIEFWEAFEAIDLNEHDDVPKQLYKFIKKNRALNYCIYDDHKIVASILSGHDGRRGTIYHLAVRKDFQNHGLSRLLIDKVCLELKKQKIYKVNITVFTNAAESVSFWEHMHWQRREELYMYSLILK